MATEIFPMKPIPSVFQWANPVTSLRGRSGTTIVKTEFHLKTETHQGSVYNVQNKNVIKSKLHSWIKEVLTSSYLKKINKINKDVVYFPNYLKTGNVFAL